MKDAFHIVERVESLQQIVRLQVIGKLQCYQVFPFFILA